MPGLEYFRTESCFDDKGELVGEKYNISGTRFLADHYGVNCGIPGTRRL